ncbi:meteorin [Protobothrops mucrosquamatus]|uniref:meteorin n=1 Tax=Protobothrops mucrosquamatus TaxID=103944 RepID=UPI0010FB4963|nr:meteorin [Protobothrops mucrosquamatus]
MPWTPRLLALLLLLLLLLLDPAFCSYSEDQCSWRGSGLSQEAGSVEQISLHCAEGSLEWLYPAGALRLSLSPRLPTGPAGKEKPQHVTACIKSSSSFRGAQIYLERDGVLELLLSETDAALQPKVRCFRWLPREKVALFLQSTLHQDISRRIAAFRYELRGEGNAHFSWSWRNLSVEDAGTCRPCNNTEILMAVCTSDFVIRGNIKAVSNDREAQESIIGVSATRIHRQKFALFQPLGKSGKSTGSIHTLLRCGVRPGPGSFLFTGWMHFAEAWLTCAPRYKDFIRIYEEARQAHENPCEVSLD